MGRIGYSFYRVEPPIHSDATGPFVNLEARVGFEPTVLYSVLQTDAFDHSATAPWIEL